jgi:H+-translocating NAD(P) transhydrogenase subunit beta
MAESFAAVLYLVSAVLFILALRGLSHPTTSRQGNTFGMVGMGLAILTTLVLAAPSFGGFMLIVLGLAIGGGAGAVIAQRIPMTAMPQLVAAFHSLVGLAAVQHSTRRNPSASASSARLVQPHSSKCRSASPSVRSPSPDRSSPS